MESQRKICLNCGHECDNKYCPNCGQPTSTSRLNWKIFTKNAFEDMFRFRGGFFNTCFSLLRNPWKVIADYVHGRRISYVSPLLFLLTLAIYEALLGLWSGTAVTVEGKGLVTNLHDFSGGMAMVLMFPALVAAFRVAFYKTGMNRFNLPELCTAGFYFGALSCIFGILTIPIEMIWPEYESSLTYVLFFGFYIGATIKKACPKMSIPMVIFRLILFFGISVIFLSAWIVFLEISFYYLRCWLTGYSEPMLSHFTKL